MYLTELSTLLDAGLHIKWNGHFAIWQASFANCEVKDGSCLRSTWGGGDTPSLAMKALAAALASQVLVFHAMTPQRREYKAPSNLSEF